MRKVYVVHYNEVALKGRNRPDFLRQLQGNIYKATGLEKKEVRIVSGRLLVGISDNTECFLTHITECFHAQHSVMCAAHVQHSVMCAAHAQHSVLGRALGRVFGISSFSPAVFAEAKYEEIEKTISAIADNIEFKSFAIRATRGDKKFPITSKEIEIKLGDFVRTKFNKNVKLDNPDVTFYVEVFAGGAVVYTQKIPGAGGLPVGIQGKAIALLSGGIDSPVAAYRLMKRGAEIIGAHFHSYPFTNRASIDKVKELAGTLRQYGGMRKVYFIPIAEAQKEIVKNCNERYRVLLYRRLMFKIAQEIARKHGAQALITGESLGQVASQTMENIAVVEQAARMPVFRPLIGYDKQEIIMEAQRIGTYEISIQPHDDCCSLFMPKQAATRARLRDVEKEEQKIGVDKLITDALFKIEELSTAQH